MRLGRYHARDVLRLTDAVASGASLVMGGQSLAAEMSRERLEQVAFGKPDRPAPTVVFAEDAD